MALHNEGKGQETCERQRRLIERAKGECHAVMFAIPFYCAYICFYRCILDI